MIEGIASIAGRKALVRRTVAVANIGRVSWAIGGGVAAVIPLVAIAFARSSLPPPVER